jgi:hypothetical protein
LKTTTRDEYSFDVTTGEIVYEYRFWRRILYWTIALLVLIGVLVACLVYRYYKASPIKIKIDISSVTNSAELTENRNLFQCSLRSLIIIEGITAVLFSLFVIVERPIAVFLSGITLAIFITGILVWTRRRIPRGSTSIKVRIYKVFLWMVTLLSWFLVYVLSFFPVGMLMDHFYCKDDFRMVVIQVIYAPIYWLYLFAPHFINDIYQFIRG